jgi:hypothetical protein
VKPEPATDGFAVPVSDRYFEDYTAGFTQEYGSLTVTEQEVIDCLLSDGSLRARVPRRCPAENAPAGRQTVTRWTFWALSADR